jgi:nucleotide-binding universal stress UspA family protein
MSVFAIRKILSPTDFSDEAAGAFRLACALARDHQAEVVVLHVMPPPLSEDEERARRLPDDYKQELWREYLLPLCASAPGTRVRPRLEEGSPVERILGVAKEEGCDLIVMGTHGRKGLRRLLMGSVAESVVRAAPCPVMTLRPGRAPADEATPRPAS